MGFTRLYRYDISALRGNTASSALLVPATGATLTCHMVGASAAEVKDVQAGGGGTTLLVYDTGNLKANDTVQLGTDSAQLATIDSVQDGQLTMTATSANFDVTALGQRIVQIGPSTEIPRIYTEVNGTTEVAGGPGVAPVIAAGTGASSFWAAQPLLDIILSGGGLLQTELLIDQHGSMPVNELNLPGFGGREAAVVPTSRNNDLALKGAVQKAKVSGNRVIEIDAGIWQLTDVVPIDDVPGLTIRGKGSHATELRMTNSTTAPVFEVTGTTTDFRLEGVALKRTAGTAHVLDIQSTASRTTLKDVLLDQAGSGITDAGIDTLLDDVRVTGTTTKCLVCTGTGGRYANLRLKPTSSPSVQIEIGDTAEDLEFHNVNASLSNSALGGVAVSVLNTTTDPQNIKFFGGTLSGGDDPGTTQDAVTIAGGTGIKFVGTQIQDSNTGFNVSGGSDVRLSSCTVVGVRQHGALISAATGPVRISDWISSNVSEQTADTYDHIQIAGTVDNVAVNGITVGNGIRGTGTNARYGVWVEAGAGKNVSVIDVNGDADEMNQVVLNQKTAVDSGSARVSHVPDLTGTKSGDHEGFAGQLRLITTNVTTINVQNIWALNIANTTGGILVDTLEGGERGQLLHITNTHGSNSVTIVDSASIVLIASANTALAAGESMLLMMDGGGTIWREITIERA